MKYYHITKNEKKIIKNIIKKGLISNEGEIYLFENKTILHNGVGNLVSDIIALNQIFLCEYAMFEIDSAGLVDLLPDDATENTRGVTWVSKQKKINPEHINLFGVYEAKFNDWSFQNHLDE